MGIRHAALVAATAALPSLLSAVTIEGPETVTPVEHVYQGEEIIAVNYEVPTGFDVLLHSDMAIRLRTGTRIESGASVRLRVESIPNLRPVATPPAVPDTPEDTPVTITLAGTDGDGDALTFVVDDSGDPGIAGLDVSNLPEVVLTPVQDHFGSVAFEYRVFDGVAYSDPGTVSVEFLPVPDLPVPSPDQYALLTAGQVLTVSAGDGVLANDVDPDLGGLTAVLVQGPAHGVLQDFGADGSFSYLPGEGYRGLDSFTYSAVSAAGSAEAVAVELRVAMQVDARETPLKASTGFDWEAYQNDAEYREAYLAGVVPGRVWETAEPGVGVPRLRAEGSRYLKGAVGDLLQLQVEVPPGAPVTFFATDRSIFVWNGRRVVTLFDENGDGIVSAAVEVRAGREVVLAGSPLASDSVRFVVKGQ